MTGWFKKPIEKVDDLKGLKMRIPGSPGASTSSSASTCGCCRRARSFRRWSAASSMRRSSSAPIWIASSACSAPPSTLHHRLARNLDRHRADHQQGELELAAARPEGDRRDRMRGLQRHQRSLVPEEQRRGDGGPDQEPGRQRAPLPDDVVQAMREATPRSWPKRPPRTRSPRRSTTSYMGFMEKCTMGRQQRRRLSRQDPQGLT